MFQRALEYRQGNLSFRHYRYGYNVLFDLRVLYCGLCTALMTTGPLSVIELKHLYLSVFHIFSALTLPQHFL
jgi:hypothetical protein